MGQGPELCYTNALFVMPASQGCCFLMSWGRQEMNQELQPLPPVGRPGRSFWLWALAWQSWWLSHPLGELSIALSNTCQKENG